MTGESVSKLIRDRVLQPLGLDHRHDAAVQPRIYYGLGMTIANGWQFQNPFLDGYTGAAGYLAAQDLS